MGAELTYNPLPWWEYGNEPTKETLDFCNSQNYIYERVFRKIEAYKTAKETKSECLDTCYVPHYRKDIIGETEYNKEVKEMNQMKKLIDEYWEKLIIS